MAIKIDTDKKTINNDSIEYELDYAINNLDKLSKELLESYYEKIQNAFKENLLIKNRIENIELSYKRFALLSESFPTQFKYTECLKNGLLNIDRENVEQSVMSYQEKFMENGFYNQNKENNILNINNELLYGGMF